MADVLKQLLELVKTATVPELGPKQREGVLPVSQIDRQLDAINEFRSLPSIAQQLIRATIYLWHDDLDASHSVSQSVDGSDGSYVHGIMHRREPDYGNARYWFHRVGDHACFGSLAERTHHILASAPALQQDLVGSGKWNPFGFIDACEHASAQTIELLREIQAIELKFLLERFAVMR